MYNVNIFLNSIIYRLFIFSDLNYSYSIIYFKLVIIIFRNKAIADYLSSNSYHNALEGLKKDADMPGEVENKYGGLLEKKWTSVIRLQKKVVNFKNSILNVHYIMFLNI